MATKPKDPNPTLTKLRAKFARKSKTQSIRNWSGSSQRFTETDALGLTDKLGFGKHKTKTVKSIIKDEPLYLVWLLENTKLITVKQTVKQALAGIGIKLKPVSESAIEPQVLNVEVDEEFEYNISFNDLEI